MYTVPALQGSMLGQDAWRFITMGSPLRMARARLTLLPQEKKHIISVISDKCDVELRSAHDCMCAAFHLCQGWIETSAIKRIACVLTCVVLVSACCIRLG